MTAEGLYVLKRYGSSVVDGSYVQHVFSSVVQLIFTWFLVDLDGKRFRLLRSMLLFRGLSVCHVRTLCSTAQMAEDIDMISFAHDNSVSLPGSLKFGVHRSTTPPL